MHPRIYQEFERICSSKCITGSVLEVGAVPSDACLLTVKSLANATEKIGVNLEGPSEYKDVKILKANGNCLTCFDDARFDAVLCNAVLEHDRYFWKTVAEIKRVTKPGGWVVIGVPGYIALKAEMYKSVLRKIPLLRRLKSHQYLSGLFNSTVTFQVHNHPGDYYRFSAQAISECMFRHAEGHRSSFVDVSTAIRRRRQESGIDFCRATRSPLKLQTDYDFEIHQAIARSRSSSVPPRCERRKWPESATTVRPHGRNDKL